MSPKPLEHAEAAEQLARRVRDTLIPAPPGLTVSVEAWIDTADGRELVRIAERRPLLGWLPTHEWCSEVNEIIDEGGDPGPDTVDLTHKPVWINAEAELATAKTVASELSLPVNPFVQVELDT